MLPKELRQYSNRRIFIALGAIILVVLLGTIATVLAISQLMSVRQAAQAHNVAREHLDDISIALARAESSQRSFILTGNPAHLEDYLTINRNLPGQLGQLEGETKTQPYADEVAKLRPLVLERWASLERGISVRQTGGFEAAQAEVQEGRGPAIVKRIDTLMASIADERSQLLERDRSNVALLANLSRDISLAGLVVILILAFVTYHLYIKAVQSERDLDRAKDEFVSLASHQLRTPATGIKSILSMLVAEDFGPLNERQTYFMGRALESNTRELKIIEELLNVAKADAGRLVLATRSGKCRSSRTAPGHRRQEANP